MKITENPSTDTTIDAGRRDLFTKILGGAILAAAGGALLAKVARAQSITDADILNFALNLEYLEGEFYSLATTGQTLAQRGVAVTGSGTQGQVITKAGTNAAIAPVAFTTPSNQQFATELAQDELNHVLFLRSALGSVAVAEPQIDLFNSFNTAASAAGIGSSFDPFSSEAFFLIGAYVFEDVGVTAYQGAAPLISNKSAYLPSAAGILAVEAYHAASIRTRIIQATASGAVVNAVTLAGQISTLRAKLDGTNSDDIGVFTNSAYTVVDDNLSSSIATTAGGPAVPGGTFPRSTAQVLDIVYAGGAAGTGGGFFPNGTNGTIR